MWCYPFNYEVIVIGGGHAGCEAALAASQMGCSTLLLTTNLDTIGKMSCNPAIGGIGKGHIVREIDALGGAMGRVTDRAGIQFRMLNATKGPAVRAPRAQADKVRYQSEMKHLLEKTPNLHILQGTAASFRVKEDQLEGLETEEGIFFPCQALILSSGTFMKGVLHIGDQNFSGGRAGDRATHGLSHCLEKNGFSLERLKTGTPPRVLKSSIDFSQAEEQPPEEGIHFSFDPNTSHPLEQRSCWIAYTTPETQKIIEKNLHRSPLYSGKIQSVGPRYCPSIEDKVVRFADKERHQLFLEPEGLDTEEFYLNGISTSLPFDVQIEMLHSIPALKEVVITRPAYAIEYDYVISGQVKATLETKKIQGLYLAGQINGTTGYEEAAGQGLMAGINAGCQVQGKPPFVLSRSEAYIGVMIDDLITKEHKEPYRMFTSRAEYRLLLRQDNADLRLTEYGYQLGTIDKTRYALMQKKKQILEQESTRLSSIYKQVNGKGITLAQLLSRPEMTYRDLCIQYPDEVHDFGKEINFQIETNLKYAGYITRQQTDIQKMEQIETLTIPDQMDFREIVGLRNEAKDKLDQFRPQTLGQASRLPGVSPADIQVLIIHMQRS